MRNKAPSTRTKFLGYIGRFQLLTGLSPEQFLHWCKSVEAVEVQDLIDKTSIEFKPAIQFCYGVALRSFLRHNGYNSLPKTRLEYVPQAWHRGYNRDEIQRLLECLRQKPHKLFVVMAAESGLRSHVLIQLRYCHIMEDLQSRTSPLAIRLEPRFYSGKKAAGYSFLGEGSVQLIRECLDQGLIAESPDSRLIPRSYYGVWAAVHRAKQRLGLDPRIQSCHGFRKYFENVSTKPLSIMRERCSSRVTLPEPVLNTIPIATSNSFEISTERPTPSSISATCKYLDQLLPGRPMSRGLQDSRAALLDRRSWMRG